MTFQVENPMRLLKEECAGINQGLIHQHYNKAKDRLIYDFSDHKLRREAIFKRFFSMKLFCGTKNEKLPRPPRTATFL